MNKPEMPFELQDFERHRHTSDKLVREVLKQIGKGNGCGYRDALKDFRARDYDTTLVFWRVIEKFYPGKFNQVEYCLGCRAFHLWFDSTCE